ncbi:alanyl-tRNA editing protein [Cognatishimia activa]|uniref:Alanine--tRNA ligase n=1 Tax=Cognatishimia activa TaxID=1715691 RepID=A0A0P1IUR7_9RHOB|nr:alanyl-tRNA editing protein [Cognatishimia activa]CUJ28919.1 Alanine--tRNA ligase [Cognatishimia activa]CUK27255.1 Alanine--tRNA ligase [Cognatishimia activa]
MTDALFRENAYERETTGYVEAHTPEGGIVLDASIFYPTGGGQPGDSGHLAWDTGTISIATAVKAEGDKIALVPAEPSALPPVGTKVIQHLDWERRHRHMRIHTALHLLSVVIPLPVTGGSISAEKGRLDFDMPEALEDKEFVQGQLNALISQNLPVTDDWITDAELDANPNLIKTMSVQPPRGSGRVRLVRIGQGADQVDLQPCGGTHVAFTGEIGTVRIGKVEKKGRQNRRVNIFLED